MLTGVVHGTFSLITAKDTAAVASGAGELSGDALDLPVIANVAAKFNQVLEHDLQLGNQGLNGSMSSRLCAIFGCHMPAVGQPFPH